MAKNMNRRSFLRIGTAGLLVSCAPAIVKASNLMPVKVMPFYVNELLPPTYSLTAIAKAEMDAYYARLQRDMFFYHVMKPLDCGQDMELASAVEQVVDMKRHEESSFAIRIKR